MPEISSFYGIRVTINFLDHVPPHFHAEYGDDEALINITTLSLHKGFLPRRALRLVLEWAALHQDELLAAWERAQVRSPLGRIQGLD